MRFLTPAERRAVAVVALLFALGAGRDLWRVAHPRVLPGVAPPSGLALEPGTLPIDRAPSPHPRDSSRSAPPGASLDSAPTGQRLDLNRATPEELDRLPGVGPVLARRIIEHRERQPFRDVEELLAVRGIGPKLLERLRGRVKANPP